MRAAQLCLSKRHIVGSALTLALTDKAEFDLELLGAADRQTAENALLGLANCPCPTFLAESGFDTAEFAGWKFFVYRQDFPMLGSARVVYMIGRANPPSPEDDGGDRSRRAPAHGPVGPAAGSLDSIVDKFALAAAAEHLAGGRPGLSRTSIVSAILTLLDCAGGPAVTGFHLGRSLKRAGEWDTFGLGNSVHDVQCRKLDDAGYLQAALREEILSAANTGNLFRIYLQGDQSAFARVSFGVAGKSVFMRVDSVRAVCDGCRYVVMPAFLGMTARRAGDLLSQPTSPASMAGAGSVHRLRSLGIFLVAAPRRPPIGNNPFLAT